MNPTWADLSAVWRKETADPLYLDSSGIFGENVVVSGPMAIGLLARWTAPAIPPATTAVELWDRRRCHAQPNSRLTSSRTYKAGYRDELTNPISIVEPMA